MHPHNAYSNSRTIPPRQVPTFIDRPVLHKKLAVLYWFTGFLMGILFVAIVQHGAYASGQTSQSVYNPSNVTITGGTVNGITALGVNGGYTQSGTSPNTFTGQTTFSAGMVGYTLSAGGSLAPAGTRGQYLSAASGANSLTSGTPVSLTSISLPPGFWMITATCGYSTAATTSITRLGCGISATNSTFDTGKENITFMAAVTPGASTLHQLAPVSLVSVNSTTIYYPVCMAVFSTAALQCFTSIQAVLLY